MSGRSIPAISGRGGFPGIGPPPTFWSLCSALELEDTFLKCHVSILIVRKKEVFQLYTSLMCLPHWIEFIYGPLRSYFIIKRILTSNNLISFSSPVISKTSLGLYPISKFISQFISHQWHDWWLEFGMLCQHQRKPPASTPHPTPRWSTPCFHTPPHPHPLSVPLLPEIHKYPELLKCSFTTTTITATTTCLPEQLAGLGPASPSFFLDSLPGYLGPLPFIPTALT